MPRKSAVCPAATASRPRKCSPRMLTKSQSVAKGAAKAAPSSAFHADSSRLTTCSSSRRPRGMISIYRIGALGRGDRREAPFPCLLLVDGEPRVAGPLRHDRAGAVLRGKMNPLLNHDIGHLAVGRDPDTRRHDVVPRLECRGVQVLLKPIEAAGPIFFRSDGDTAS